MASVERRYRKGYIGVTHQKPRKRFEQHRTSSSRVGRMIRRYRLTVDDMTIVHAFLDRDQANRFERKLRPSPNMGWNEKPGGAGIARSEEGRTFFIYHIPHRGRYRRKVEGRVLLAAVLVVAFIFFAF